MGKLLPAQPRLSFPVGSAAPGSLWALTPSAHLTFLAHESRAVPTVYSERVWITLFTFPWVSRDFCFRRHIPSSLPLALITRCPQNASARPSGMHFQKETSLQTDEDSSEPHFWPG